MCLAFLMININFIKKYHMYLYSCWQPLATCSSGAEWTTFNVAQRLLRRDMLRLYGNKKLLIQHRMSLNTASRHVVWGLYFIQVATCQTTSSRVSCCSAHAVPCSPSCSFMYTHPTLSTACPLPSHFHVPTHSLTHSLTHALTHSLTHSLTHTPTDSFTVHTTLPHAECAVLPYQRYLPREMYA